MYYCCNVWNAWCRMGGTSSLKNVRHEGIEGEILSIQDTPACILTYLVQFWHFHMYRSADLEEAQGRSTISSWRLGCDSWKSTHWGLHIWLMCDWMQMKRIQMNELTCFPIVSLLSPAIVSLLSHIFLPTVFVSVVGVLLVSTLPKLINGG